MVRDLRGDLRRGARLGDHSVRLVDVLRARLHQQLLSGRVRLVARRRMSRVSAAATTIVIFFSYYSSHGEKKFTNRCGLLVSFFFG